MIEMKNNTEKLLMDHCLKYPLLKSEDIFKFLFQSALGCEHLVSDEGAALDYLVREYQGVCKSCDALVESLDGKYSRVHLSILNDTLDIKTFAKLFCLSAKKEENGIKELAKKLEIAGALIDDGVLPIDIDKCEFENALEKWAQAGYPAVRHSEIFRAQYHPAYRVIDNGFVKLLPLFSRIDKLLKTDTRNVVVAIEGGSASGKSTLASLLAKVYDCNLFHADDYFLRPEQRTPQRLAQVGGNLDRERFDDEIISKLKKNEPITYRPFDCSTQTLDDPVTVNPKKLTVVEGVYSMHPEFDRYFDLSLFLDISPSYQKERILKRNPPFLAKRFFEEWIPLENVYFAKTNIKERCDLVILADE